MTNNLTRRTPDDFVATYSMTIFWQLHVASYSIITDIRNWPWRFPKTSTDLATSFRYDFHWLCTLCFTVSFQDGSVSVFAFLASTSYPTLLRRIFCWEMLKKFLATCDKECVMVISVHKPISFYYT